jgi:hypothetical protein
MGTVVRREGAKVRVDVRTDIFNPLLSTNATVAPVTHTVDQLVPPTLTNTVGTANVTDCPSVTEPGIPVGYSHCFVEQSTSTLIDRVVARSVVTIPVADWVTVYV